jgi:hypothetical protein
MRLLEVRASSTIRQVSSTMQASPVTERAAGGDAESKGMEWNPC